MDKEPRHMDQKTRKLMTIYKALQPRDDIDRLYMSKKKKKKAGREHASVVDNTDENTREYSKWAHFSNRI